MTDVLPVVIARACVSLIGIPLGLVLAAVILRWACRLVGVRVPEFSRAMGIVFVTAMFSWVAVLGLFFGLGVTLFQMMDRPTLASQEKELAHLVLAIGFPVNLAISAGLYVPFLEVTIVRGILIGLTELLLRLGVVALLGGLAAGVLYLTTGVPAPG